MFGRLLRRRAGRRGGWGIRLGLRTQIAALGLGGVALIAVIYLVGLRFEAEAQRTADDSAVLESLITNVAEGFLEARQLATEFLKKRDEKLLARHDQILAQLRDSLATIEALIAPLPDDDPLKRAGVLRSGIN